MITSSHTSTGNQAGNTPISNALEIAIKQNVVNIYRELSPVVVGVKDFVSKEDSQKRLRAAERCRHEILSCLYAGDQVTLIRDCGQGLWNTMKVPLRKSAFGFA